MKRHSSGPGAGESPVAPQDITTAEVAQRLSRKLRSMIGPGRAWSFGGVSHLTGIDERSLRAYVRGDSCPNLAKYKRLLSVLGPELAIDLDAMIGWRSRASASAPGAISREDVREDLRRLLALIDEAIAAARRRET